MQAKRAISASRLFKQKLRDASRGSLRSFGDKNRVASG